jgi:UrcA family protein
MTKLRSTFATALFTGLTSLTVPTVALPTPALAAMPGERVSITVPTRDLDLSGKSGQAALRHRLSIAAAEACGDASSIDPEGRQALRRCRAELVRAGQRQALAATATVEEQLAAR